MSFKVLVFSDYVCPYCFLAEGPLAAALEACDEPPAVAWMPFELRPHPTPTLEPAGEYLQTAWRDSVYPLAAQMGVEIVLPKISPQPYTRLAFEGALFARDHDAAAAYNHKMFTAFFQEERDIGDPAVLTACAGEIGLDEAGFAAALANRTHRSACEELLAFAIQTVGIQSVPTFLVGRYLLPGLARTETLLEAFARAGEDTEAPKTVTVPRTP